MRSDDNCIYQLNSDDIQAINVDQDQYFLLKFCQALNQFFILMTNTSYQWGPSNFSSGVVSTFNSIWSILGFEVSTRMTSKTRDKQQLFSSNQTGEFRSYFCQWTTLRSQICQSSQLCKSNLDSSQFYKPNSYVRCVNLVKFANQI